MAYPFFVCVMGKPTPTYEYMCENGCGIFCLTLRCENVIKGYWNNKSGDMMEDDRVKIGLN